MNECCFGNFNINGRDFAHSFPFDGPLRICTKKANSQHIDDAQTDNETSVSKYKHRTVCPSIWYHFPSQCIDDMFPYRGSPLASFLSNNGKIRERLLVRQFESDEKSIAICPQSADKTALSSRSKVRNKAIFSPLKRHHGIRHPTCLGIITPLWRRKHV